MILYFALIFILFIQQLYIFCTKIFSFRFHFTKLPDRFIISFEAPVIQKVVPDDYITPDQAIVHIKSVPTLPALLSVNADVQPSVGSVILQKQSIQDFSYDRQLASALKADPNLLNTLEAIVNKHEQDMDPEQLNKHIKTLTDLLEARSCQNQQIMANAFYCCDLSMLLHAQLQEREQIIYQNMKPQNRDLMRLLNYAPPEYLLQPCDVNTEPSYLIQTRKHFLNELNQSKTHVLDQQLCRYYTLQETTECGIDYASLVPDQFLIQGKKLAKGKISAFELRNIAFGQNQTCSKGTDGQFLLENLQIREDLQSQPIIVFAVTTADNKEETVLQEPCSPEEFQGYKFKQQDNCAEFEVHMRFNISQPHMVNWFYGNQKSIAQNYQNRAGNRQQQKNARAIPKGARPLLETEKIIYDRFPQLFVNNFDEYYSFLQNQNIDKNNNHSLYMTPSIKVKDVKEFYQPNKKFIQGLWTKKFWSNLSTLMEQISKVKHIQIEGEMLNLISQKLLSDFKSASLNEYKDLGEKPIYAQLFDWPTLFMIIQGIYSNLLQFNSPMYELIHPFMNVQLNMKNLILASMNLVRGIEQLLCYKIAVDFNASYLVLEKGGLNQLHLISPYYTAWAMTTQYGYGLLEHFKIVKQLKRPIIQEYQNHKRQKVEEDELQFESAFQHCNRILEYLQTLTLHQIRNINKEPLSPLTEKIITSVNECSLEEVSDKFEIKLDDKTVYDFKTVNDYIIGIPCVPQDFNGQIVDFNALNAEFSKIETDEKQDFYVDLLCEYLVPNYHMQASTNLYKQLKMNGDDCDQIFDEIMALTQLPSQGPLRLLQTGEQELLLAPMTAYGIDFCVVQRMEKLKSQLRNCGYDMERFDLQESSYDQGANKGKQLVEVQKQVNELYQFTDAFLNPDNCVQFQLASKEYKINVPKSFLDVQVKHFWDFVAHITPTRIQELGLDQTLLAMVADIDRYSRYYRPGIVYNSDMRAFVYMPLLLSSNYIMQSQSSRFNVNLSKQAEFFQQLVWQEPQLDIKNFPDETIQCSALEFVNREQIPSKLQNKLNEASRTYGNVRQVLTYIGRQLIHKNEFERLLALLVGEDINNRFNISLNQDMQSIQKEYANLDKVYYLLEPQEETKKETQQNIICQIIQTYESGEKYQNQSSCKPKYTDKKADSQVDDNLYELLEQNKHNIQLMQLVLDNFNDFDAILSDCMCILSTEESNYINCKENLLEQLNTNKQFVFGKGGQYNNFDLPQTLYKYSQYQAISQNINGEYNSQLQYKISVQQYLNSAVQLRNHYDFMRKDTYCSRNFVILARYAGFLTAYQLYTGQISPDDPQAGTKKFHGFTSVKDTLQAYEALNDTIKEYGELRDKKLVVDLFKTHLNRVKSGKQSSDHQNYMLDQLIKKYGFFQLNENEQNNLRSDMASVTVNTDLDKLQPFEQFYTVSNTKILAPLFKQFGVNEQRGISPLKDIFGRVLRSASPYTLIATSNVRDDPIQLDTEAPPAPAAAGEESAAQSLIDFWENVKNKFFQLPDERIRALTSPLYSLEEREIEFLAVPSLATKELNKEDKESGLRAYNYSINPKDGPINQFDCQPGISVDMKAKSCKNVGCKCSEISAVLYPSTGNTPQLDQDMRGIYYLSPYYIPPLNDRRVNKITFFKDCAVTCVNTIAAMLIDLHNDNLGEQKSYQFISIVDSELLKNAAQVVAALFLAGWPQKFGAQHIISLVDDDVKRLKGVMPNLIEEVEKKRKEAVNFIAQRRNTDMEVKETGNVRKTDLCNETEWKLIVRQMLTMEMQNAYVGFNYDRSSQKGSANLRQFFAGKDMMEKMNMVKYAFVIIIAIIQSLNLFSFGDPEDPLRPVPDVLSMKAENKTGSGKQDNNNECEVQNDQIKDLFSTSGKNDDTNQKTVEHQSADVSLEQLLKDDSVLAELIAKQNELQHLEQANLEANAKLAVNLRELKAYDIRNDLHELFATAVNSAWAKLCVGDKAKDAGRVSHDQLALGGFETNGPRGDYSGSAKLSQIAKEYNLDFGHFDWEKDCFDLADLVEFD